MFCAIRESDVCPECKTLKEAHIAARERVLAAGRHPSPATPEQLMELHESEIAFDEIKAKLEAHEDQCSRA
jgi:hypothetical protein